MSNDLINDYYPKIFFFYLYINFYFRKLENNEKKEMVTNNISPQNSEDTKSKMIFSYSDTVSKLSPSLQQADVVKNKCNVSADEPKLPNASQAFSAVDSENVIDCQLTSNKYINIYNRYQVI